MQLIQGSDDVFAVGLRVAIVAVLTLLGALVLGWSPLVPASLVLLGALYGGRLAYDDAPLDETVAVFAAGVVVIAELAYWSLEERDRVRDLPGEALRRLAFVALLGVGALVLCSALLALVDVLRARGLAVDLIGAVAAAAVLAAVVLLARRQARSEG